MHRNIHEDREVDCFNSTVEGIIIHSFRTIVNNNELSKCFRIYLDNKDNFDKEDIFKLSIEEIYKDEKYLELKEKSIHTDPTNPLTDPEDCNCEVRYASECILGAAIVCYCNSNNLDIYNLLFNGEKTNKTNIDILNGFNKKFAIRRFVCILLNDLVETCSKNTFSYIRTIGSTRKSKSQLERLYLNLFILGYSLSENYLK